MASAADPRRKPDAGLLPRLPSPILKPWGSRPMLRCTNDDGLREIVAGDRNPSAVASSAFATVPGGSSSGVPRRSRFPPEVETEGGGGGDDDDDGGLEELRAKLMGHLREAADRIKVTTAAATSTLTDVAEPSSAAARPWNLRTRRAACKRPLREGEHPSPRSRQTTPPTISATTAAAAAAAAPGRSQRTVRLRSEAAREGKKKRPKFSVALTAEEIEEDIYAVTGSRPRRRPMKRPRAVQRQLDALFPGLWLTEITSDMYKVSFD